MQPGFLADKHSKIEGRQKSHRLVCAGQHHPPPRIRTGDARGSALRSGAQRTAGGAQDVEQHGLAEFLFQQGDRMDGKPQSTGHQQGLRFWGFGEGLTPQRQGQQIGRAHV